MDAIVRVDKPYAITRDNKIVHPSHPMATQILAVEAGTEVPAAYLVKAGLVTDDGKTFRAREYDEVAVPPAVAMTGTPSVHGLAITAPIGEGTGTGTNTGMTTEQANEYIAAEVRKQVEAALANQGKK